MCSSCRWFYIFFIQTFCFFFLNEKPFNFIFCHSITHLLARIPIYKYLFSWSSKSSGVRGSPLEHALFCSEKGFFDELRVECKVTKSSFLPALPIPLCLLLVECKSPSILACKNTVCSLSPKICFISNCKKISAASWTVQWLIKCFFCLQQMFCLF